ncbi:hypothetical protein ColLi_10949 [Colletotrichum liriopes]|uniref:Uncharacterized protein n=1 Tax=Colletotrichum liriopes TaxID=708192 RepID=A0AA37GVK9_9PEZI|nr:hypothetical protein ColLi_10949 [Colletotrichum liriopes]
MAAADRAMMNRIREQRVEIEELTGRKAELEGIVRVQKNELDLQKREIDRVQGKLARWSEVNRMMRRNVELLNGIFNQHQ